MLCIISCGRRLSYKVKLCSPYLNNAVLNLLSLERRRLRAGLILAFKGEVDLDPSGFFLRQPQSTKDDETLTNLGS